MSSSWLDTLYHRATEAKREPQQPPSRYRPAAPPTARPVTRAVENSVAPIPRGEIKVISVTTRSPTNDGDPGARQLGYYWVSDGTLTMCDEAGTPGKSVRLGAGDDPRVVAARMTRNAWLDRRGNGDFWRPLHYPAAE
jgi:hypothetical protein